MRTNVRGPLKISEALLRERQVKHVETYRNGVFPGRDPSVRAKDKRSRARIYYKTSKAALNMAMTTIATATKDDGIIVVALHPGGVNVEKLKEYDFPHFIEPEESISSMVRVIAELTPAQSGAFLNYTGETLPW